MLVCKDAVGHALVPRALAALSVYVIALIRQDGYESSQRGITVLILAYKTSIALRTAFSRLSAAILTRYCKSLLPGSFSCA